MTANVECAGLPAVSCDLAGERIDLSQVDGCGWKGERFTRGATVSTGDGSAEHPFRFDFEATARNDREAMTRKPCPRCGGRVELIPTTSP